MASTNQPNLGRAIDVTSFPDTYREGLFLMWYEMGCPALKLFYEKVPPADDGRTATEYTVREWFKKYQWKERASRLNTEVAKIVEAKAVEERVQMLNRQAEYGLQLQEMGIKYLEEHDLNNDKSAITAIIRGAELERNSRGLPDALQKVAKMQDSTLEITVRKLLSRMPTDQLKEEVEKEEDAVIVEENTEEGVFVNSEDDGIQD
jgi:hypothetical protein